MSHLTQMAGLAVQNFVSAAVGIAVAVALVRGLVRRRSATIGNFWVDLTRVTVRVLLPLAIVLALLLASQGVVQSLRGPRRGADRRGRDAVDLPGADREPGGDQGARDERRRDRERELGAPVREPDRRSRTSLENWALLAIPFALAFAFGRLVGDRRQGWALFAAMFVLWIASAGLAMGFELDGNPRDRRRARRTWRARRCASAPPPPASSPPRRRAPRPAR